MVFPHKNTDFVFFGELVGCTNYRSWVPKKYITGYLRKGLSPLALPPHIFKLWSSMVCDYYEVNFQKVLEKDLEELTWQGQPIEIDVGQISGLPRFRMWAGSRLLGSFFRKNDGTWYAKAEIPGKRGRICQSARLAQLSVIGAVKKHGE